MPRGHSDTKFAEHRRLESDEETTSIAFVTIVSPSYLTRVHKLLSYRYFPVDTQTCILDMVEVSVTLGYIALLVTYSCINSKPIWSCKIIFISNHFRLHGQQLFGTLVLW